MSTRARTFLPATIGAAIAIFAVVAPAPRVSATTAASACTATSGVTVIVDFTHFGGNIERGCATGHPTDALAALHAAGFGSAGTANYGDAFLCRIDGLPKPAAEACATTPPANSSWSFYSAHPTDSAWTYSTAGVLSYQPAAGSIIAFAFGNYAKPGVNPAGAVVTHPTTTTTPPGPTVTAGAGPTVSVGQPPVTAGITTPAPLVTTSPSTAPATTPARPTPTSVAATTSTASPAAGSKSPRVVDRVASPASSHSSSGSALPALLTVTLVALLGAGAAVTIRARRRRAT